MFCALFCYTFNIHQVDRVDPPERAGFGPRSYVWHPCLKVCRPCGDAIGPVALHDLMLWPIRSRLHGFYTITCDHMSCLLVLCCPLSPLIISFTTPASYVVPSSLHQLVSLSAAPLCFSASPGLHLHSSLTLVLLRTSVFLPPAVLITCVV